MPIISQWLQILVYIDQLLLLKWLSLNFKLTKFWNLVDIITLVSYNTLID